MNVVAESPLVIVMAGKCVRSVGMKRTPKQLSTSRQRVHLNHRPDFAGILLKKYRDIKLGAITEVLKYHHKGRGI